MQSSKITNIPWRHVNWLLSRAMWHHLAEMELSLELLTTCITCNPSHTSPEKLTHTYQETRTRMSIAVLFTVMKMWTHSKNVDNSRIDNYTMEYYINQFKKNPKTRVMYQIMWLFFSLKVQKNIYNFLSFL